MQDVLDVSGTTQQLTVVADAGDTVEVHGDGLSVEEVTIDGQDYFQVTDGSATLLVSAEATLTLA